MYLLLQKLSGIIVQSAAGLRKFLVAACKFLAEWWCEPSVEEEYYKFLLQRARMRGPVQPCRIEVALPTGLQLQARSMLFAGAICDGDPRPTSLFSASRTRQEPRSPETAYVLSTRTIPGRHPGNNLHSFYPCPDPFIVVYLQGADNIGRDMVFSNSANFAGNKI